MVGRITVMHKHKWSSFYVPLLVSLALILKTTEQGLVDLQNNCVVKTLDLSIASKAKVIYKMYVYFHIQNLHGPTNSPSF